MKLRNVEKEDIEDIEGETMEIEGELVDVMMMEVLEVPVKTGGVGEGKTESEFLPEEVFEAIEEPESPVEGDGLWETKGLHVDSLDPVLALSPGVPVPGSQEKLGNIEEDRV